LEVLATLVERYEAEHFPLDLPDPIEAIKFRMEQAGLSASDMQPYLGNLNRVYEVLNRKRGLSLAMIRRLNRELKIPAEVLIA
jgi:HTH-type transcriptional regulator/antitoxin HigA